LAVTPRQRRHRHVETALGAGVEGYNEGTVGDEDLPLSSS